MEPVLRQMCAWGEWYSEQMSLECQQLIPEAEAHLEKHNGLGQLAAREQ